MVMIHWLFLLHVILLLKLVRMKQSTNPLETEDDAMINDNMARSSNEISNIQSKLNRKHRSVYHDHLKIHQRSVRSLNNASVTSNKTGDLFPNKTVTITKPFTFRIDTVKAVLPQLVTPYPTADVNLTIPGFFEPRTVVDCPAKASSCSNRCTNETYFVRYSSFGGNLGKICNCDSSCNGVFTDCCSDFAKECSDYHVRVKDKTDNVQLRKSSWRCETKLNIAMDGCTKARLWMITQCPIHSPDDDTKIKCHSAPSKLAAQSIDSFVPVVGSSDQLTYRNQYCAKCNNVLKFEFMTLIFKKEAVPPPYFTQEELHKFIDRNLHNFENIRPKNGQKLRSCFYPNTIDSCPTVFHDARDACTNGTVGLVESGGKVFKNKDCALCNGVRYSCGVGTSSSPCSIGPKSIDRAISLRDYGVSLKTNSCPRNQVYDPYLSECRENYEVTELKKSRAVDKYQVILSLLKLQSFSNFDWRSLKKTIAGYFKMNESQVTIEDVVLGFSEIRIICTLDLTPAQSLIVASDPEFSGNSNDTIGLRRLFKFQEAFELEIPEHGERYTIYRLSVRQTSCFHQQVYKMEEYAILDNLRILVNSTGAVYYQSEYYLNRGNNTVTVCSKLLPYQCNGSYIKLNTSEYHLFDNLTLHYNSLMYKFGDYFYEDEKVLICVQFNRNYTISHTRTPKDDLALIVLTWLGFILSILGLLALLFTYTIFQELRTLPGKNLMSLSISLCLAEILWLCGSIVNATETACTVIAIANHYFFLVFFSASSVIAFDSCLIFGRKISFRGNTSDDNQTFRVYLLVTWCFPAIFVFIFALLDHYEVFVTDYGKSDICWLGTRDSKLFLFIVPFGILLLFNLLLFSFIAIRLYKNYKSSVKSLGRDVTKKRKTQNVLVCVKLSALMGFAWLFGLLQIAVETESDVFAYLFVIFVSFQGLFICVSFLFKRNSYNLYASFISKSIRSSSSKLGSSVSQGLNISTPKCIDQETKL